MIGQGGEFRVILWLKTWKSTCVTRAFWNNPSKLECLICMTNILIVQAVQEFADHDLGWGNRQNNSVISWKHSYKNATLQWQILYIVQYWKVILTKVWNALSIDLAFMLHFNFFSSPSTMNECHQSYTWYSRRNVNGIREDQVVPSRSLSFHN